MRLREMTCSDILCGFVAVLDKKRSGEIQKARQVSQQQSNTSCFMKAVMRLWTSLLAFAVALASTKDLVRCRTPKPPTAAILQEVSEAPLAARTIFGPRKFAVSPASHLKSSLCHIPLTFWLLRSTHTFMSSPPKRNKVAILEVWLKNKFVS